MARTTCYSVGRARGCIATVVSLAFSCLIVNRSLGVNGGAIDKVLRTSGVPGTTVGSSVRAFITVFLRHGSAEQNNQPREGVRRTHKHSTIIANRNE